MPTYFEKNPPPLYLADFDYFRLPRERWELLLTRLRQMGANGLMVAVPWGFHELEPGRIDLAGHTNSRRDLVGLLHLATALDLPCLLNFGPALQRGLLNDGLPLWLAAGDTALLAAAKRWYTALSQTLTPEQWPAGPIVAVQIDDAATTGLTPALSSELTEVKWPIWLRKHYPGIQALNAAYDSDYRTVSQVPFPETWAAGSSPLERDARRFLEEEKVDLKTSLTDILSAEGWQVPVYSTLTEPPVGAPAWQSYLLTGSIDRLPKLTKKSGLHLPHPIETEPDPIEVGSGPGWASKAPIRADGSVRHNFWRVRQALWSRRWPASSSDGSVWCLNTPHLTLITAVGDVPLKVETEAPAKSPIYRLRLSGELVVDETLQVTRKKMSGLYRVEDETDQTDLVALLADPTVAFPEPLLSHLRWLLVGQAETLSLAVRLAAHLSEMLAVPPETDPAPEPAGKRPMAHAYVLDEARRGLSQADAALRKALSSIGGLEQGFATMLDRDEDETTESVPAPLAIHPAAFEGTARQTLLTVGERCGEVASGLETVVAQLGEVVAQPFNLADYQEAYRAAVTAAQAARRPLLDLITQLRRDIVAAELPLVIWRIHDQVQIVAECLRWGVLRG